MPIVTLPFKPREWQRPLINDPAPRIVAVVHRRAGKSAGLMWRGLKRGLTIERRSPPPRIVHTLPLNIQWSRTGLWDRLAEAAKGIPGAEVKIGDMRVLLPNGAVYQAGGLDNPDSWRGGYADEVIFDEFDDNRAEGMTTAIMPMLVDYGGTQVYSGTPKGLGRLKAIYDRAGAEPGWSRYLLRWQDTGVLTADQIRDQRADMTPEEFAQEFECSWDAPNSGAYWGREMQEAETSGRITSVPYDPRMPVTTAWDLGIDDSTAIWFVQIMRGGEWHVIDYIEDSGQSLAYYAGLLKQRGYVYERHLLPHDVEVEELGTGVSRKATLGSLGVRPIATVPAGIGSVADGINAARMRLPMCWFDASRCARGIMALRGYRREWNADTGVFKARPLHDACSHGADAFRYLCMGARETVGRERSRRSPESPAWSPFQSYNGRMQSETPAWGPFGGRA